MLSLYLRIYRPSTLKPRTTVALASKVSLYLRIYRPSTLKPISRYCSAVARLARS